MENNILDSKLEQLDIKIQEVEAKLIRDSKRRETSMLSIITAIKADILKDLKKKPNKIDEVPEENLNVGELYSQLGETTQQVQFLNYRLDKIAENLNNTNNHILSNDFKKDVPNQEQLTEFAIKYLFINTGINIDATKDLIPNGTKIKNTYNNHIWILNRIVDNGLTITKWEDFGSDNICIANNNGVHGLVTGSQDKFRGYIDVNGVISINGLEEELNSVTTLVKELINKVDDLGFKLNQIGK